MGIVGFKRRCGWFAGHFEGWDDFNCSGVWGNGFGDVRIL